MTCPHCHQQTYVACTRPSAFFTGWGCTNCGSAIAREFSCEAETKKKKCGEKIVLHFRTDDNVKAFREDYKGIETKLCDKHLQDYYSNLSTGSFRTKNIPSWRLAIDDATPEEVLNAKSDTFGMPTMTRQQWDEYYKNSPHEQEKMRTFNEQRVKEAQETLRSGG